MTFKHKPRQRQSYPEKKINVTLCISKADRDIKLPALKIALNRESISDIVRYLIDFGYKTWVKINKEL